MNYYDIKIQYLYKGERKNYILNVPESVFLTKFVRAKIEGMFLLIELNRTFWDIEENTYITSIGEIKDNMENTNNEDIEIRI